MLLRIVVPKMVLLPRHLYTKILTKKLRKTIPRINLLPSGTVLRVLARFHKNPIDPEFSNLYTRMPSSADTSYIVLLLGEKPDTSFCPGRNWCRCLESALQKPKSLAFLRSLVDSVVDSDIGRAFFLEAFAQQDRFRRRKKSRNSCNECDVLSEGSVVEAYLTQKLTPLDEILRLP